MLLNLAFDGDRNFTNRLQKNPWHRGRPAGVEECNEPRIPLLWEAYKASRSRLTYVTSCRAFHVAFARTNCLSRSWHMQMILASLPLTCATRPSSPCLSAFRRS